MINLFNYSRRHTHEVMIGVHPLGSNYPIRLQSMTNTKTTDTEASVAQAERIIKAGGEYVRLTTQGTREAENLKQINAQLRGKGINTPLVADVHFNPNVANVAARYAEKVRINPGNYVNSTRTLKEMEYTEETYAHELAKIEERFIPFLAICRENHTAIRIGVNHGSLSDRIMNRYGDTPEGIVESCMEFLRICVREKFENVTLSIKASNTVVMVQSVRLLVEVMDREGMNFPLHLGVTEAGDGEDGRIKSAVGIGALLADGIGDTIRVSLSEAPELEIPVAQKLVEHIIKRTHHEEIVGKTAPTFNYACPVRRKTHAVGRIGGEQPPVVVAMDLTSKRIPVEGEYDFQPDYIYCGHTLPPKVKRENAYYIVDVETWNGEDGTFPAYSYNRLPLVGAISRDIPKFLFLPFEALTEEVVIGLTHHPEIVIVSQSNHINRLGQHRALVHELMRNQITNPVVFCQHYTYSQAQKEDFQLVSSADMGALLFDGFVDGLMLINQGNLEQADIDATAFGILQAARLRTSKTEYISCPGCGRTLYNLEETIARIKASTSHLKGLKIAIMGCIVNGPGEMADADYGYVGAGRDKVSLYRKKECVEQNIPTEMAVIKLLELIHKEQKTINT